MGSDALHTGFAPAERAAAAEVQKQGDQLRDMPLLRQFIDASPEILVVLNDCRQVVYSNRALLDLLGVKCEEDLCGLRPGEVLHCVHANENEAGCGTTEFCSTCGAVRAILDGLAGNESVQECRIGVESGDSLDLRVRATPLKLADQQFVVLAVVDISNEKRRQALERIFFHDILNTAGGVNGYAYLLTMGAAEDLDKMADSVYRLSNRLIDEIKGQRELLAAESNELRPELVSVDSLPVLHEVAELYRQHQVAEGREVVVDPASESVRFPSDRALLTRVVGNMTKNALEASPEGGRVTLSCRRDGDHCLFEVHNPSFMPRHVQLQIFQRSYSTKGAGRGLGTYSMKLLSERYLGGGVSFESNEDTGTVFRARYPVTPTGAA
jgi:signal transduction histidine kinase